jgi:hypothetical protein
VPKTFMRNVRHSREAIAEVTELLEITLVAPAGSADG